MTRLLPPVLPDMTPEQKQLYEVMCGTRGGSLGGPMSIMIRTPHLAGAADALHTAFRLAGKLNRRAFEMLVLMVAHHYKTAFAWVAHERLALQAGLPVESIQAIMENRPPAFADESEKAVYEVSEQLLAQKTLDEALYRRASRQLGSELLIETVAAVGFYSMVCLLLNSFDVDPSSATGKS
jgi:4-carboxymuconolactone decarboxylase